MNSRLEEALADCLAALDSGQSLETVLQQHPEQASELRKLLDAAQLARAAGAFGVPDRFLDRGRIDVLRRAAELRTTQAARRSRWMAPLPRLAISLLLVVVLVLTSTRLVSASSTALPGDQLYSVKRSWEDLQLFFVFQAVDHQLLESRFTQERLDEANLLLAQGRAAPITFSGLVMHQQDGTWLVSGIRVSITAATGMPSRPISSSDPVMITGVTGSDGTVVAQQVQLLQPGVALPPLEPSDEAEVTGGGPVSVPQSSGGTQTTGPGGQPAASTTQTPSPTSQQPAYQFTGVVGSIQGSAWTINGQPVYLDRAQVTGDAKVGSIVTFEGYYGADGRFEVAQLTVDWSPQVRSGASREGSTSSGSNSGAGESGDQGGGQDSSEGH